MRPAPAWGYRGPRSFALAEFDPFWRNVEESGVLVVLHASDSGYNRYTNEWEGAHGEALAFGEPRLFSLTVEGDYRAIRDAATSLICHGALQRFPKLRIALVENGGGWVPHFLEQLDHAYEKAPHRYEEQPSATFKRHFWMHPFHEEDPRELVHLLGADHVIFGSDFPHIEGLADPLVVGRRAARAARRRAPSRHGRQHDAAPRHSGLTRRIGFVDATERRRLTSGPRHERIGRGRIHQSGCAPGRASLRGRATPPPWFGSGAHGRCRQGASVRAGCGSPGGRGGRRSRRGPQVGQRSRLRRGHDGHLARGWRRDPDQRPPPRERPRRSPRRHEPRRPRRNPGHPADRPLPSL